MAHPSLYITRILPDPVMAAVRRAYRLVSEPIDRVPTTSEYQDGFALADAAIATLADPVNAALLSHAGRLKVLANYAVGYNNIDLDAARERGIVVTNTPDVLTDATADLTWALLLAVARRVPEGDAWLRTGKWPGWAPTQMLGSDLAGKVLGIVGMGRIGLAVAQRARGFGMLVLYAGLQPGPSPSPFTTWTRVPLHDLLAQADFVSLHVPLTASTHHLIGPTELALMKPTSFLINTSRGAVIDEQALVSALRAGTIAGAGLDVYEQEPIVDAGLIALPNVVLLPHLGSATLETRIRMGMICLENIAAVLSGRLAPNPVT